MRVLITAGLSNLGAAIAKEFFDNGWEVYVTSRRESSFEYGTVIGMDLLDSLSISKARERFDQLDVLVNNAGIFTEDYQEELDESSFDEVFDVNVKGLFLVTKAFLPLLRQSDGSIVNISSINALHPGFGRTAHYDASKGAVSSYTASLASETGLRVNAVAPGLIYSESLAESALDKRFSSRAVKKSMVIAKDIAKAVYFLSTSEGIYGQTLTVDNGYLLN